MVDEHVILGEGQYGMAMEYLFVFQELAIECGISPQAILKDTGVPLDALIQQGVRIGHRSFSQVVKNLIDAVDDATLPIQYAKRMTMLRHGALGYAFQSAKNLFETSELLSKYVDTRSGGGQRFERIEGEDTISIVFSLERQELGPDVERFQCLALLFNVEYLGRYLTGTLREHVANEIQLTGTANGDISTNILPPGLTITYNQPVNQLICPKEYFYRPLVTADQHVFDSAMEHVEKEMMLLDPVVDIALIVRNKLRDHTGKLPSLQKMADDLHFSASSLKRKLKNVGATYQQLRESVQFHKANYLLATTQYPIEQIADMLGYADGSNFNKAFKQWSGLTPSEYRKKK